MRNPVDIQNGIAAIYESTVSTLEEIAGYRTPHHGEIESLGAAISELQAAIEKIAMTARVIDKGFNLEPKVRYMTDEECLAAEAYLEAPSDDEKH